MGTTQFIFGCRQSGFELLSFKLSIRIEKKSSAEDHNNVAEPAQPRLVQAQKNRTIEDWTNVAGSDGSLFLLGGF